MKTFYPLQKVYISEYNVNMNICPQAHGEKVGESVEVYFKIKEIAQMCDISVRALHLYDKMDLLKPEYIDEGTGYRYYSPDQVQKLTTIISFKKVGFSLAEIKNMFENNLPPAEVLSMLKAKAEFNRRQIDIASYNIENIQNMIHSLEQAMRINTKKEPSEEEEALRLSKIVCLENEKLEHYFSQILWL